jgi:hypothetical protein
MKYYTIVEAMLKAEKIQALQKKFEETFLKSRGSAESKLANDRLCIAAGLIDAYREGQASMVGQVLVNDTREPARRPVSETNLKELGGGGCIND